MCVCACACVCVRVRACVCVCVCVCAPSCVFNYVGLHVITLINKLKTWDEPIWPSWGKAFGKQKAGSFRNCIVTALHNYWNIKMALIADHQPMVLMQNHSSDNSVAIL